MEKQIQHYIPFSIPSIGDEEIVEVIDTLRSGWITTGPRTHEFERRFAAYIGVDNAIAVNSCTAGLHLALTANGVGPGDEVITTPFTFAATGEVIIHCGAKPVFADIASDSFNIDPQNIEMKISSATRAIIPVHFAGEPCKMDEILRIADKYELAVIEDAAHALGTKYKGKSIGTIGAATSFSFYATKNLTTGEGGMITTSDANLAHKMRILSLHGLSRDAWKRYSKTGTWYYEIEEIGFKYNMSDIQAAIGLKQLEKFSSLQRRRKILANYYRTKLQDIDEIALPEQPTWSEHAWHLFVIRVKNNNYPISRNELLEKLNANGIGTSVHFIPLHLQPYWRDRYHFNPDDYPIALDVYQRAVSLPIYPKMTEDDVEFVIATVRSILKSSLK